MASFAPAWARGLGPGSDVHVSESEEAETAEEDETEGESEEEGVTLHSCDAIALRFFQTVAIVTEAVAVLSAMTNGAAHARPFAATAAVATAAGRGGCADGGPRPQLERRRDRGLSAAPPAAAVPS